MDADYNYDSEEEVDYSKMDMVSIFFRDQRADGDCYGNDNLLNTALWNLRNISRPK